MAYAMWGELTQGVPIWLEKFLLGPIVKTSLVYAVSRLLIHLLHVFESEFASDQQRCDNCVDLHMIYVLRMALLIHNLWVALLCF